MTWVIFLCLLLVTTHCQGKKEDINESNELTKSQHPTKLDENLRKALLEAISDLEKEDNETYEINEKNAANINKVSADDISIFTKSETVIPSDLEENNFDSITEKSESTTISTKEDLNELTDTEQILTSSSNSFTLSNSKITDSPPQKNQEKIFENLKEFSSENKIIKHIEPTTIAPTTSTEENEAKVEDVQFFSAPLVAAFTVHQDEQGVPKKVESIFKPVLPTVESTSQKEVSVKDELKNQERTQHIITQAKIQQRQRALEQEILRLNLNLKRQQELNQQQELFLRQQTELLRLRNNVQPVNQLTPISYNQFSTEKTHVNKISQDLAKNEKEYNIKNINRIKNTALLNSNLVTQQLPHSQRTNSFISLTPSITFDPLVEAGKLPKNGQVLPTKNPSNFHAPIIQTSNFQQFHSVSQVNPVNSLTINNSGLQQNTHFPLVNVQRNRFLRQETGVSNEFNKDYSSNNQALQSRPNTHNFPHERQTPGFSNNFNPISPIIYNNQIGQQPQGPFQQVTLQQLPFQQVNNRFYRPNRDSSFRSNFGAQQINPPQLGNFVYRSQPVEGRSNFNVFPKTLTFNYVRDNQLGSSLKYERRVPFI